MIIKINLIKELIYMKDINIVLLKKKEIKQKLKERKMKRIKK